MFSFETLNIFQMHPGIAPNNSRDIFHLGECRVLGRWILFTS